MASLPPTTNTRVPSVTQPFTYNNGIITQAWLYFLNVLYARTGGITGGGPVWTGTIQDFAGPPANIPLGYLNCDGSAVSRTTYAGLFTAIGTTWGDGDGTTTFNVPDLNARFTSGGTPGETGGNASIVLTLDQLPAHSHTIQDPGHVHASVVTHSTNTAGAAAGSVVAGNTSSAQTGIIIDSAGNGGSVDIRPLYAAVLKIIKT